MRFIQNILVVYIAILLLTSCTLNGSKAEVESVLSDVLSSDYRIRNHSHESLSRTLEVLVKFDNKPNFLKRTDLSADVYLAKGVVYASLGDNLTALYNFKEAKSLYKSLENGSSYITSQLYIAKMYGLLGDVPRSLFITEFAYAKGRYMSPSQLALFIEARIIAYLYGKQNTNFIIESLPTLFAHKFINWRELYDQSVKYNAIGLAQAIQDNFSSSISNCIQFDINPSIFRIEQGYIIKKQSKIYKIVVSLLISFLFVVTISLIRLFVQHRNNEILFENEIKNVKKIRRKLSLTSDVLDEVDKRLRLLDNYIISEISGNYILKANAELAEMLDDKDYFLRSTIDCFLIAHPHFIMYLRELRLSDEEIACCCLFASGLKGKDIANYMGWTRGYDKIAKLRNSLGIKGRNINIDKYLKKTMIQLDQKYQNVDD